MRKLTIESTKANLMGVLFLLPAVLLFGLPFYYLWHDSINFHAEIIMLKANIFTSLLVLLVFMVVHELLHALAYLILTQGDYKNISFGIIWKNMTPYCHYAKPISVLQYRIAVITPGILTGVLPLIYALAIGDFIVFAFGILFLLGAIGDFIILWIIRNERPKTMLKDHPDEIGCIIMDNE